MATLNVSIADRPHVWWRIAMTLMLLPGLGLGMALREAHTLVQTKAAMAAVNGDSAQWALSHAISGSVFFGWALWLYVVFLVLLWSAYLVHLVRFLIARPRREWQLLRLMVVGAFVAPLIGLLGGCGDFHEERFEEVAPNETAFVIPLSGSKEEQEKFKSLDYLKSAKVSAKRIQIPTVQHDTGYGPGAYTWLPTVKVIKVDRSPITREWVVRRVGSSVKDQAIAVESLESIGFSAGATITVSIREEDTPQFLYYYFGKKLEDVMDQNVRSFVQMVLSREFGNRMMADCMKDKAKIFEQCFQEAKALFAQKGITIEYFGSTEGLEYDDPKIQEAINRKFVAQTDIMTAQQEALAAAERNKVAIAKAETDARIRVANAKADAEAAEQFMRAGDAMILKAQLDIAKAQADAMKTAAERWKGDVPATILPAGTNMMFGLDRPVGSVEMPRATTKGGGQ
ncbi:MAG TPA: SPFH domain-containing protein [Tepidisphaeraceae bacterium]|jgi:hypothetical protein|nr:SPFH domain-containing protein [Tepidisphaeraceae bacterium]